jgi:UDP-N-acetylmuramoylalanine--D-glutamate ligase
VNYYNDSKATNVGAALAAIEGLGADIDGKLVLIAGGDGKGAEFKPCAIRWRQLPRRGADGPRCRQDLAEALGDAVPLVRVGSLDEAVQHCRAGPAGDAVLLSPACASFDMFKNFEERGHLFARAVEELA